uniref:PH domain-containing protein n=1 Tax=Parastrongyloides trichosuri TaxID=131310 RepID=A0A0N5A5M1_PARTI
MYRQPSILDTMRLRNTEKNKKLPLRLCSEWRFDSSTILYGNLSVLVSKNTIKKFKNNVKNRFVAINNNKQLYIYTDLEEGYVINLRRVKLIKEKFNNFYDNSQRVSSWNSEIIIISDDEMSPEFVSLKFDEIDNIDKWRECFEKCVSPGIYQSFNNVNMTLPSVLNNTKNFCKGKTKKSLTANFNQSYAFDRKISSESLGHSVTGMLKKTLTFRRKSRSCIDDINDSLTFNMKLTKSLNFSDDLFVESFNRSLAEAKLMVSDDKLSKDSGVSTQNSRERLSIKSRPESKEYDSSFHYNLPSPIVAERLASLKGNNLPLFTVEMGLSLLSINSSIN